MFVIMSSQKGNACRKRPQKHKNTTSFANNKYGNNDKSKALNNMELLNLCQRCKDVIQWKIKYNKYKPLTVPKKCVSCGGKTVKAAYNIICENCAVKKQACAKCQKKEEGVAQVKRDYRKEQLEFERELKALPERKRRTVLRYIQKAQEKKRRKKTEEKADENIEACGSNKKEDFYLDPELMEWAKQTLSSLKIDDSDDSDIDGLDSDSWEDASEEEAEAT